jgi:hypothetical protein
MEKVNMSDRSRVKETKQEANNYIPVPQISKKERNKSKSDPFEHILSLQRTAGNQAVQKILQSRSLQAKLQINGTKENDPRDSLISRAVADSGRHLDESVRIPMEDSLGVDLRGVKVHSGPASDAAAESLGARAYTIGSDIYMGQDARKGSEIDRKQLLAHEAVHTIQQGGQSQIHRTKLDVSSPSDPCEMEADRISESVIQGSPSRSLALLENFRHGSFTAMSPLVQRDIKGDYDVKNGKFTMDLKTESHPGAKSGLSGTIKFNADEKAPDSNSIRLLQVVRTEDLTTGKDYVWTGPEANRNKVMTAEDKARGVEPGFFVDHSAAAASPRTKKTSDAVSPYYRTYWPNKANSQDGSKKGKDINEASLWDYPGANFNIRFSFETLAKADDTGYVYGTVMWGFTISDASKGVVDKERAVGRNVTLLTTDEAIRKFNEFYRNPGASTAPK